MVGYLFYKPIIDLFIEYINGNYLKEVQTIKFLTNLAQNLTLPHLWFSEARMMNRTIYLHIGQPNSSKYIHTLNILENAEQGIFLTDNKHLSYEVYNKLKINKNCDFISEELINLSENSTHIASTIRMCDISKTYKLAVIHEFHFISDFSMGYFYTNALLGLKCDEIHICVDEKLISLIKKICSSTNDIIKIISHSGDSSLVVEEEQISSVSKLKNGDCIVVDNLNYMIKVKNVKIIII